MSAKLVVLLTSLLFSYSNLKQIDNGFSVVSTTESFRETTQQHKVEDLFIKIEETNQQLAKLSTSFFEKQLNCAESSNKNFVEILKRLEQVENTNKQQQEQISELQRQLEEKSTTEVSTVVGDFPKNCKEIAEKGDSSGIYKIRPESVAFDVKCDMETEGGGWVVFQNRFDGSQDFNQEWKNYKEGFGNLNGEFWLGLEYLHQLTNDGSHELLIRMEDRKGKKGIARYQNFNLANETQGYAIKVLNGYSGSAGDSLNYHLGAKFSTVDRDNSHHLCANTYKGGWWFNSCLYSNLNGQYVKDGNVKDRGTGVNWYSFSSDDYSLLKSQMLVRPK